MAKRSVRTRGRKQTQARRRAAPAVVVTIRAFAGGALVERPVLRAAPIVRLAEEWTYTLRSRARWLDNQDLRDSIRGRALTGLEALGVTRKDLEQLATADHVEVELHEWDSGNAELAAIQKIEAAPRK